MIVSYKRLIFGPTKCFMYSVKWQKRGLPHVQRLTTRLTPCQTDSVISAEMPDPDVDLIFHEIVRSSIIYRLRRSQPTFALHG